MRQHMTFFVLAALVCMLSITSCGGSKPAAPPGNTRSAPGSAQSAPVHIAQPARATPSISAKMICAREAQAQIGAIIGAHMTAPVVPTWTGHLYSCRYVFTKAVMALSVKELSDKTQTDGYFSSLARRLGVTTRLQDLGQGAFTTKDLSVVVRKDYKVLLVDTSGLPAIMGGRTRAEIASLIAATIMDCWTGD
jgi:hypothetical protein